MSWRTFAWGIGLQIALVLFIDKVVIFGTKSGREFFRVMGEGARALMDFTQAGTKLVFGDLGLPGNTAYFAFGVLPTIIFIASFFTVLYYFGVIQLVVRVLARVMMYLLGTSGAETLSVSANVFMGQTEAPLIVKPYIPRHDAVGVAHDDGRRHGPHLGRADGGLHGHGRRRRSAILATSVMAAPCSLYLSKLHAARNWASRRRGGHVKTRRSSRRTPT